MLSHRHSMLSHTHRARQLLILTSCKSEISEKVDVGCTRRRSSITAKVSKRERERDSRGTVELVLKVQQSRVQLFYVHANFALSSRGNLEDVKGNPPADQSLSETERDIEGGSGSRERQLHIQ